MKGMNLLPFIEKAAKKSKKIPFEAMEPKKKEAREMKMSPKMRGMAEAMEMKGMKGMKKKK